MTGLLPLGVEPDAFYKVVNHFDPEVRRSVALPDQHVLAVITLDVKAVLGQVRPERSCNGLRYAIGIRPVDEFEPSLAGALHPEGSSCAPSGEAARAITMAKQRAPGSEIGTLQSPGAVRDGQYSKPALLEVDTFGPVC